ncbi:hypothetical protein SFA35_19510 [Pseudomonas sp. HR96]|uniref:hypothetical protein n=1 Tax=Pseudomonas sp. HR96 TaxID=1027966 RepID=UPI002A74ADC2|nr:hypothetical protein [Pseudomonas sp. HR96]WPO98794.1 hypothetical protein SFA35_19510 [Pseudomonas sp. HR96]
MNSSIVLDFVSHQHQPDAWLYLLLDPLAEIPSDDPLHLDALRLRLGQDALTSLPRPDLEYDIQHHPVLITIASPGGAPADDLLRLSGWHAQRDDARHHRYVCGWLSSTAAAQTVSRHLQALSLLPTPAGQAYQPLHEPLRLELMAGVIGAGHPAPWWPVRRWLIPASSGDGLVLEGYPEFQAVTDLELADRQEDIPLASALLDIWRRTLSTLEGYAPGRWTGPTSLPPFAVMQALAQIQQARTLELTDPEDILQLAIHRLMLHPRLHWHPRVRQLIGSAARDEIPLADSFDHYHDQDWELIVNELEEGAAQ